MLSADILSKFLVCYGVYICKIQADKKLTSMYVCYGALGKILIVLSAAQYWILNIQFSSCYKTLSDHHIKNFIT